MTHRAHPDMRMTPASVLSPTHRPPRHIPCTNPVGPGSGSPSFAFKSRPTHLPFVPFLARSLSPLLLLLLLAPVGCRDHDAAARKPSVRARRLPAIVVWSSGARAEPIGRLPGRAAAAPPHDLQPRVRPPLPSAEATPPRGTPRPGGPTPVPEPRASGPPRLPRSPLSPSPTGQRPPPGRGLRPVPAARGSPPRGGPPPVSPPGCAASSRRPLRASLGIVDCLSRTMTYLHGEPASISRFFFFFSG